MGISPRSMLVELSDRFLQDGSLEREEEKTFSDKEEKGTKRGESVSSPVVIRKYNSFA